MIYLQLFWEFFKTGLFAIGGGLATLPFLRDISLKYPWFTPEDLLNMIAVSESTPGPLGVNSATYAGFHAAGVPGALVATCSLVLPSVIIIILVSRALTRFRDSKLVQDGFYGLRPASAGLIFGAILEVFAASLFHTELWDGLRACPRCSIFLRSACSLSCRWRSGSCPASTRSCSSASARPAASYSGCKQKTQQTFLVLAASFSFAPTALGNLRQHRENAPPQPRFPAAALPVQRFLRTWAKCRLYCPAPIVHKQPQCRTAPPRLPRFL